MNVRAIIGEADNGWVVEVPGTVRMIPGHEPQVLSEQATRVAHNGTELVAVLRDLLGFSEGPQVPEIWEEAYSPTLEGLLMPGDADALAILGPSVFEATIERARMKAQDELERLFGDAGPQILFPEGQQEARPSEEKPGEWLVF